MRWSVQSLLFLLGISVSLGEIGHGVDPYHPKRAAIGTGTSVNEGIGSGVSLDSQESNVGIGEGISVGSSIGSGARVSRQIGSEAHKRVKRTDDYRTECNAFFEKLICYRIYKHRECDVPEEMTCWDIKPNGWNCTLTDNLNYLNAHLTGCAQEHGNHQVYDLQSRVRNCRTNAYGGKFCQWEITSNPFDNWTHQQRMYQQRGYACGYSNAQRQGDGPLQAAHADRFQGKTISSYERSEGKKEYNMDCNNFYGRNICFRICEAHECQIPKDWTCWKVGVSLMNCTLTDNLRHLTRRNPRSYGQYNGYGSQLCSTDSYGGKKCVTTGSSDDRFMNGGSKFDLHDSNRGRFGNDGWTTNNNNGGANQGRRGSYSQTSHSRFEQTHSSTTYHSGSQDMSGRSYYTSSRGNGHQAGSRGGSFEGRAGDGHLQPSLPDRSNGRSSYDCYRC